MPRTQVAPLIPSAIQGQRERPIVAPGTTMFLTISKALAFLVNISTLLVVVALAGAIALSLGRVRLGRMLVWCAVLGFLLVGFGPIGFILMQPLENRFPRPPDGMAEPTGIILLGGTVAFPSGPRGVIALTEDGERLSETATLAHRYPNAMVVISGGSLGNPPEASTEAFITKRFLVGLGVEESRIVLEPRSLSTAENAAFTRALLMPQPGQRWLLVTSASHMPRAVGAFRKVGFPVIPYPVGYTTSGRPDDYWAIRLEASTSLVRTDVALHEWVGLIAYWLTRRTDEFLPAPQSDLS